MEVMFWRHDINVPAGFEAVVDGKIETRRPLRVGRYEQIHLVSTDFRRGDHRHPA
jgi:hypothetical protein